MSKICTKKWIGGRAKNPGDKGILEKAKTILGCDSPTSCKAICEQEANREKCSGFAKQAGLEGGIRHTGPGGCDSEQSCRSYCEKSPDECKRFAGSNNQNNQGDDRGGQNKGPGGCDSESSCRKYCSEHPNECQRPPGDSGENSSERRGLGETNGREDVILRQVVELIVKKILPSVKNFQDPKNVTRRVCRV